VKTKLTLRLDEDLIEQAKAWAKARDMSLSDAVAQYFKALAYKNVESQLSERTRRLIGIARRPGEERAPTDEEIREEYIDYLEKKYR
jgi:hypothetical protein